MVEVYVSRMGFDSNGNSKWLYQFVDREQGYVPGAPKYKDLQREFNCFGRVTNRGISTQTSPVDMQRWFTGIGANQSLSVFFELGKAQKEIDRCNKLDGCRNVCGTQAQAVCHKLKAHAAALNKLMYCSQFLKVQIVETAKPLAK